VSVESQTTTGRPRDPQKDHAVLQATRELLVEVGYQETTVLAIARRAGVSAPTIYRRWPRREALIEDAAFDHTPPAPLPRPSGDLRADLRRWVSAFLDRLADPVTRAAIPGLLQAYHNDARLYERLVARSEHDVRDLMATLLDDSIPPIGGDARQERADAVFDLLVGAALVRALTVGLQDADIFCEHTADALTALTVSAWQPGCY
jgi:AcrR family transcriptional regulator